MTYTPNDKGYMAGDCVFRRISKHPPPTGVKLLFLTEGRVCVIGHYKDGCGFIKWSPLPKDVKDEQDA